MSGKRAQGPVEILCREIGMRFERPMETVPIFVAFVEMLVNEVEYQREMQVILAERVGSVPPSDGSRLVLNHAKLMLEGADPSAMMDVASEVHDLCREHNPECVYPTDHLIDQISLCVSAIRFGLKTPCSSRHAAGAAHHVWGQRYGIRLFDEFTSAWSHDWARDQMRRALLALALRHDTKTETTGNQPTGNQKSSENGVFPPVSKRSIS